jgi:hypothetical protein
MKTGKYFFTYRTCKSGIKKFFDFASEVEIPLSAATDKEAIKEYEREIEKAKGQGKQIFYPRLICRISLK